MKGNKNPTPRTKKEDMVRREYYITKVQDDWLKQESQKLDKPAAEILREALNQVITQKAA